MNFLAHLTLSHFDPDLQVGNYLADFVKGQAARKLPESIQRGIAMHRAIDRLTDRDGDVQELNRLIAVRHGRYAGVVTDIAFDYFLWQNWSSFGPENFHDFRQATYQNLGSATEHMDDRITDFVHRMTADDWLRLYTSREGMQLVFRRLAPRLSKPELIVDVHLILEDFSDEFNHTIQQLFPRLQDLSDEFRTP
jgi:acyl carrier protein phosphodiesterase